MTSSTPLKEAGKSAAIIGYALIAWLIGTIAYLIIIQNTSKKNDIELTLTGFIIYLIICWTTIILHLFQISRILKTFRTIHAIGNTNTSIAELTSNSEDVNSPVNFHTQLTYLTAQKTIISTIHEEMGIDLKHRISLNQRYLFEKDLFKGSSVEFETTIAILNETSNDKITQTFEMFCEKYGWDKSSMAFIELEKLINIRLNINND